MAQTLQILKEFGQLGVGSNLVLSSETIVGSGSGTQAMDVDKVVTYVDCSAGTATLSIAVAAPGTLKVIFQIDASNNATLTSANTSGTLLPTTTLTMSSAGTAHILISRGADGWGVLL